MADNTENNKTDYEKEVEGLNPAEKKKKPWKLMILGGVVLGVLSFSEAYRFYQDVNERLKLTQHWHLKLTHPEMHKADRRTASI